MSGTSLNTDRMVINLPEGKKIYFASDLHLGTPNKESSLEREKAFVKWLNNIKVDAYTVVLAGDIFDFWFEYKHVVPRGYVRLLGKLAELSDNGINIIFFAGNHDMWIKDYLEEECGITIFKTNIELIINGKTFVVGHGDGLGKGDIGYKFIKKLFACKFLQWLYARFHPNFAFGLAKFFSRKSRIANGNNDEIFKGENYEQIVQYIKSIPVEKQTCYYIFGHRHLPLDIQIGNSRYINLGEWVKHKTYAVFDNELTLKKF